MSGIECTLRLKTLLPSLLIIMFTVNEDDDKVFQALRAGACGYLLKRSSTAKIIEAVSDVVAGGAPMSSAIARKVLAAFHEPPASQSDWVELSPRERELLDLISTGASNKEAADTLHLTVSTVYEYLKIIYNKLHVHSRTAAVIKYLGRPLVL
jgi:DNA-binding NarL/FixJ family response regulator